MSSVDYIMVENRTNISNFESIDRNALPVTSNEEVILKLIGIISAPTMLPSGVVQYTDISNGDLVAELLDSELYVYSGDKTYVIDGFASSEEVECETEIAAEENNKDVFKADPTLSFLSSIGIDNIVLENELSDGSLEYIDVDGNVRASRLTNGTIEVLLSDGTLEIYDNKGVLAGAHADGMCVLPEDYELRQTQNAARRFAPMCMPGSISNDDPVIQLIGCNLITIETEDGRTFYFDENGTPVGMREVDGSFELWFSDGTVEYYDANGEPIGAEVILASGGESVPVENFEEESYVPESERTEAPAEEPVPPVISENESDVQDVEEIDQSAIEELEEEVFGDVIHESIEEDVQVEEINSKETSELEKEAKSISGQENKSSNVQDGNIPDAKSFIIPLKEIPVDNQTGLSSVPIMSEFGAIFTDFSQSTDDHNKAKIIIEHERVFLVRNEERVQFEIAQARVIVEAVKKAESRAKEIQDASNKNVNVVVMNEKESIAVTNVLESFEVFRGARAHATSVVTVNSNNAGKTGRLSGIAFGSSKGNEESDDRIIVILGAPPWAVNLKENGGIIVASSDSPHAEDSKVEGARGQGHRQSQDGDDEGKGRGKNHQEFDDSEDEDSRAV